jgi:ankyrin repeat protein
MSVARFGPEVSSATDCELNRRDGDAEDGPPVDPVTWDPLPTRAWKPGADARVRAQCYAPQTLVSHFDSTACRQNGTCFDPNNPDYTFDAAEMAAVRRLAAAQDPANARNFFFACQVDGFLAELRRLLDLGLDVDTTNETHTTGLMTAAFCGNTKAVALLLQRGARVDLRNTHGETALAHACSARALGFPERSDSRGANQAAALLLEQLADVNACDTFKTAPLTMAARAGQLALVDRLLRRGATIDSQNDDGETALMGAADRGEPSHVGVMRKLLHFGANPNVQNVDGENALMFASAKGLYDAAIVLFSDASPPPDIDAQTAEGGTALMLACEYRHPRIVELLLTRGARPNIQNIYGDTALMFAAQQGASVVYQLLRDARTRTDIENNEGARARDFAADEATEALFDDAPP